MAVVETRPELVGKRFLCVGGGEEPAERGDGGRWRAGVIRAVSQRDSLSPELAVYVEFDDLEWEKREWIKVYEDFATFLVEYQLVWAKRKDPSQTQGSKIKQIQWPALVFADNRGMMSSRNLGFHSQDMRQTLKPPTEQLYSPGDETSTIPAPEGL
ncbi:hypothetical protein Y1Q_0006908 [Alligator mississippiensis]|uniref:Uncharacterized protein n=1 Tax=Alligator mississippiensis TaxID=8496 RepID=A0A151MUG4_ALLMI|nr:hypothetical protein Y1Q_0006908 [Alligator mississippiensis]